MTHPSPMTAREAMLRAAAYIAAESDDAAVLGEEEAKSIVEALRAGASPAPPAERERFERWYDAQPDGKLSPWEVWQAARLDAIEQGHACKFAIDGGGTLYRRYREPQCSTGSPHV